MRARRVLACLTVLLCIGATSVASATPKMVSPVPGAPITQSTTNFQWSANGTAVSEWWVYVGTTVGGNELYDSGSLGSNTLSARVSGLPTNGSTVWVRLWYVSKYWGYIDFKYSASAGGPPKMVVPTAGSKLTQSTTTFQWSANGAAVSEWWVYVGTSVGGKQIHDSGSLSSGTLSRTVSGLPTNGSKVWLRLWYVDGYWRYLDFEYTALGSTGGPPEIVVPLPGSQITQSTTSFQWAANGTGVSEWWVYVGTTAGSSNLYDSGSLSGNTRSVTVTGLPTDGSTVWVRLWYDSDYWHRLDVQYSTLADGISILSPIQNGLMDPNQVTVSATANGFPQDWRVRFALDGAFGNSKPGTFSASTRLWTASLGNLSRGRHVLTAFMVNAAGAQQGYYREVAFDVGDYYVVFGDSISEGIGDTIASDNQSLDGRNTHTGFAPILNDMLTQAKGYPHSVAVQGIPGYDAGDGLLEIDAALGAHPDSRYFLIQFGTNDSSPISPVPSGKNLVPGNAGYPGTFKDNMQRIINAVRDAGKVPLLAKVPIRYADCSTQAGCQSYVQRGISPQSAGANGFVRDYNVVIDQLIAANGLVLNPSAVPTVPLVAPDFYNYFRNSGVDGQGKSPLFYDWLHPNGAGYQDMAYLWLQALLR